MRALIASLFILSPSAALAAWPEDVTISGMAEHDGRAVINTDLLGADYEVVIRELGTAIGSRSIAPPATLGLSGFEMSIDTVLTFPTFADTDSPWDRVAQDEVASPVMYQPGITIRKGLPFSLEVGMSGRWMGNSRQGVFSGFLRAGLVEGYKPFPDVALHLGYSGYVGNDELEVGVFDIGLTIGTKFAVGPGEGARNARILPFADVTILSITSAPVIGPERSSAIGAIAYGPLLRNPYPTAISSRNALTVPQFTGGLQVEVGKLMFRVSGGYALRSTPTVAASVGFTY